jgi:hypothetical protein
MAAHRRLRAGRQKWPFTAGGETSLNWELAWVMPVRVAMAGADDRVSAVRRFWDTISLNLCRRSSGLDPKFMDWKS